jgi:hypothetical protein
LHWQRTGLTVDNYESVGRSFRMPRALRIEYPGAIYHIMNRGDSDREVGGERIKTSAEARSGQSAMARRLRKQSTTSMKWIADRLQMGSWSYVSNLCVSANSGD